MWLDKCYVSSVKREDLSFTFDQIQHQELPAGLTCCTVAVEQMDADSYEAIGNYHVNNTRFNSIV